MLAESFVSMSALERKPRPVFFVLLVASFALWGHPLASTLRLALENDAHTHILLIVPLTCGLICLERKALRPAFEPSAAVGASLLAGALLLAGAAKWVSGLPDDVRLSMSMFALVTWWLGSIIRCFGARAFQTFLFPLCFLFLMVPIPNVVVNGIIEFLQQQSATTARIIFRVAGVPVTQDGIILSIPGLDVEVVRECSSIRSSLILVITTMVLAHLLLCSWWRKTLLVAAAIPLSFVKNGLRIFVISELGTRVDPGFLDGRLHHRGGIVFLSIALGVVALLLWILRRTEPPNPQKLVLSTTPE